MNKLFKTTEANNKNPVVQIDWQQLLSDEKSNSESKYRVKEEEFHMFYMVGHKGQSQIQWR